MYWFATTVGIEMTESSVAVLVRQDEQDIWALSHY